MPLIPHIGCVMLRCLGSALGPEASQAARSAAKVTTRCTALNKLCGSVRLCSRQRIPAGRRVLRGLLQVPRSASRD
jgi:hypothetical protein